jgi:hypothetical protein
MLMTLPYIMVPRNELQAMLREAEEEAEAEERSSMHEKVDTRMKQITPSSCSPLRHRHTHFCGVSVFTVTLAVTLPVARTP